MAALIPSVRGLRLRYASSTVIAVFACTALAWTTSAQASSARLLGRVPHAVLGPNASSPSGGSALARSSLGSGAALRGLSSPADEFTGSYQTLINQYLSDARSGGTPGSVYDVTNQYGATANTPDPTRTYTFGGTTVVTDAWPADGQHGNTNGGCSGTQFNPTDPTYTWCVTDAQVQAELSSVLAAHPGWPHDKSTVYFMLLPSGIDECSGPFVEVSGGVNQCADKDYCAYHSNFTDSSGAVPPLYAVLPWPEVRGCETGQSPNHDPPADDAIDLVSHEHNEVVTDPLGDAWYASNADGTVNDESADKCRKQFGVPLAGSPPSSSGSAYNQTIATHNYWLQDEFANQDAGNPGFAAPTTSGCEQRPGGANDGQANDATSGVPLKFHDGGTTMHTVNAYTIYWNGHPGTPPTAAVASAPSTVHRGDTASWQAAPANDPQGQAPTYTWDFGDGTSGSGPAVGHAYQVSGTYTVTLTVSDADGYQASDTRTVRVLAPPTASFTTTPLFAVAGLPVAFNSAASVAPDGNITNWSWLFGDGATASGPRVSHVYAHAGVYRATLSLADSNASTASESADVIVALRAPPPLATRGSPRTARAGAHVVLQVGRTLSCPAGPTGCTVTLSVTTVQHLVARTARGRRTVSRTVGIGTATLTARPGSQDALTLRLNSTGQTLLQRLHHLVLTVHILIRLDGAPTVSRRVNAAVGYPPPPSRRR